MLQRCNSLHAKNDLVQPQHTITQRSATVQALAWNPFCCYKLVTGGGCGSFFCLEEILGLTKLSILTCVTSEFFMLGKCFFVILAMVCYARIVVVSMVVMAIVCT